MSARCMYTACGDMECFANSCMGHDGNPQPCPDGTASDCPCNGMVCEAGLCKSAVPFGPIDNGGGGGLAGYEVETDVDYPTWNLRTYKNVASKGGAQFCADKCDGRPTCTGFVMHDDSCWLKHRAAFASTRRTLRGSEAYKKTPQWEN